jgi:hypothetical protein
VRVKHASEGDTLSSFDGRRIVASSGVREEPISSELVLVDEELARRARGALPDPPWLLPALAELRRVASAVAGSERPAPAAVPARPRGPSVASRALAAVAVALSLLGLIVLGALAFSLLPSSRGPTLAARPEEQASLPAPPQSLGARRPKRAATHPKARRTPTRQATTKAKPTAPKVLTKPRAVTQAPERAAKPKPRALTVRRAERVFTWHRYPGAVYYQFYFQQGAKTIYQARSVSPTAALPARLKVVRGTYRVLVRPAVPSDAGIILGGAMFEKTVKL